jgi:P-type Ca2+ transporter type 2C
VGTNTEWGQLMANISEDNCEETPLQVILFKDSAYFLMHKC